MEKFRIAMYGMAQVAAISYGVLASGATVKFNHLWLDQGYTMPAQYRWAIFYRDHGYSLLFLVILWAIAMSYFSSPWSKHRIEEGEITAYGLGLVIFFAILGTFLAICGAIAPPHSTLIQPLQ